MTQDYAPVNFAACSTKRIAKLRLLKSAILAFIFCAAAISSRAQTYTTLFNFTGTTAGYNPSPLVQGFNGNFYGTTMSDGANGAGTVFEIGASGQEKTIYAFCSQSNCLDGKSPGAGLIQSTNGAFYGTTMWGGANGGGTIFKITPSGKLTTLYNFCSQAACYDGATPEAALLQTSSGNFYGTTYFGGKAGWGTVFKLSAAGVFTTLYNFCYLNECTGGFQSTAPLIQAGNGNLYGILSAGGDTGYGIIFQMSPAGALTTLHTFCSQASCTDGGGPYGGLVQGSNGKLYGTTSVGGSHEAGTVFEITTDGKFTTLYNFCTSCTDGNTPYAGLVQATDGDFYGATSGGGSYGPDGAGTIFQITPAGKLTTLYSYCGLYCDPETSTTLIQSTNGAFYGATIQDYEAFAGTVYRLSMGLAPFVETLPASAKVGASVIILGNNLTGTTGVTFNGTPATFTVISSTEIKTTVPAGATTGTVQVTVPGDILNSNIAFRVIP